MATEIIITVVNEHFLLRFAIQIRLPYAVLSQSIHSFAIQQGAHTWPYTETGTKLNFGLIYVNNNLMILKQNKSLRDHPLGSDWDNVQSNW